MWHERAVKQTARQVAGREGVWAAEPADLSLLHALFYTRSNADLETLIAVDRGAQQDRVVGGSVRVAEAMATELGERVRLGDPVRRIAHDGSGVRVVTRSGAELKADHVVVTLPPTLAGRLEYEPGLPSWRDQLTQRLPAGSVIKCFAVYDEPFWRTDGLNGQAISDRGPVKITFDNSPPEGRPGVLLGFLEGHEARLAARMTEGGATGGGTRSASPPTSVRVPPTRCSTSSATGCPRSSPAAATAPTSPPGCGPLTARRWREPVGRIHWAGAECSPHWNGYMEGAVRSGEAVAHTLG